MRRALLSVLVLVLAACATPASFVGRSEADLRAQLGAPAGEYPNADGSRMLAYPQGRFGAHVYMAEVAPGGSVRAVRQGLNDDTIMGIVPGMTRDQILRLIGPPRDTMTFSRQREVSWEYYFVDTWGYRSYLFVNFDEAGIVRSRTTRRFEVDRGSGSR